MLGDFILLLRCEMQGYFLLLFFLVLLPASVLLLILRVFLLESHEVTLKEVILPTHVLDILEVTLELLGEFLNGQ